MSAPGPGEIWHESAEEGERRLRRGSAALVATGVVGGVDVMLGITALTVVSGALAVAVPEPIAHLGGAMAFGIGFVLIVVGRSELFTENFLVPIAAVLRRRGSVGSLVRLWVLTFLGNIAALAVLALMLTKAGLVPPETLDAAGKVADTFAERDATAALLSAILAGIVMTLLTWVAHAATLDISRIALAMLIGFLLAAPTLNHAVVGFGEMAFGIFADTPEHADWGDVAQNLPLSILGNLIGGIGLVTLTRAVQVRGEPAVS